MAALSFLFYNPEVIMKKVSIGVFLSLIVVSSCSTMKKSATLSDIEGEWTIVNVNGQPLQITDSGQLPFIGFDTHNGKIYGNSGCNRIIASLDLQAKPGSLRLDRMGSTLMACPDMETETKVLEALAEVRTYKKDGENGISLCDSSRNTVVSLKKRFFPMTLDEMQGKWNVVSVFGMPIPETVETTPFLIFDTKENIIGGNTGCNRIKGKLEIQDDSRRTISIPPVAMTRMACPDMETENNITSALSAVKTFGRLDSNRIALYSASGTEVLELQQDNSIEQE